MFTKYCFLIATSALAMVGSRGPAPAGSGQANGPVIVVAGSYPGANAQVVADTVAAPIEHQIDGVEGMLRIESRSGNDGKYIAHLYFKPKTDAKSAMNLVQNRVALATPLLPDLVRRNEISVKLGKTEADPKQVAIAVIDRHGHGWQALQKTAGAVMKRLGTERAITKPQVFPQDEKQVAIQLDRAKCASLGLSPTEVMDAVQGAGAPGKIDDLRKLAVRDKILLTDVATLKEVTAPGAVYRVNLHPAIRITGAPTDRKSVAAVTGTCVGLAEAELKRLDAGDFAVENLSK
jgi:multidrug efflux pump subunit AcrB